MTRGGSAVDPAAASLVGAAWLAVVVGGALSTAGLWRCPLLAATGHPCPLCGTTRALRALLGGDAAPLRAQPWGPLLAAVMLAMLVRATGRARRGDGLRALARDRVQRALAGVAVAAFAAAVAAWI